MKITTILFKQSIKRMLKFNWFIKGNRKVIESKAEDILKSYGYEVEDLKDFLYPHSKNKKVIPKDVFELSKLTSKKIEEGLRVSKANYYIHTDENVLLEGLDQAKVLTNTVEVSSQLPERVANFENNINLPEEIHEEMRKRILLSCVFDSMQEKLPRRINPEKLTWKYPREYGITNIRRNEILCKNLITICEQLGEDTVYRYNVSDAFFRVPLQAHGKNIILDLTSELAVTTSMKLEKVVNPELTYSIELPDLQPVHCTVSLTPLKDNNGIDFADFYPLPVKSKNKHIQLAFTYFDPEYVKNIFGEEVTETQFVARSLLKGFAVAAAEARVLFGEDVKKLPEPVVVRVIQTDGKKFHFTLYQLNTLEIDKGSELKNIFWSSPLVSLYETCGYVRGRPVLEDYNPEVLKKVVTFYNML